MIKPFRDRLDIEVEWLFYSVPLTNGEGPPTVFCDRIWDNRENWVFHGVGTVADSMVPYFGDIPDPELTPLFGNLDEWEHGLSYAKYLAGGYPVPPCAVLGQPQLHGRMSQAQTVILGTYRAGEVAQVQTVRVFSGPTLIEVEQVQDVLVFSSPGAGAIEQVQAVEPFVHLAGEVSQVQAVEPFVHLAGEVSQVQSVEPFVTPDGEVSQVQAVEESALPDGEVSQVQAVEEV